MSYIETVDHKTGKIIKLEISEKELAQIQDAAAQCKPIMSRDALHRFIDNLDISIDMAMSPLIVELHPYPVLQTKQREATGSHEPDQSSFASQDN